ncbi:MAG TPA: hypothetical protein VER37_07070, partial [Thermomicrobiales bacterium]|nr:hypothetical protein [Thermomicrobiales bacterium]
MTPPQALATDPTPAAAYAVRRDRAAAERDALAARWNQLANARLVAFLAAAACGAWGLFGRSALGGWLALAGFVAFAALAVWHNRVGKTRDRAALAARLNEEGLARIARDWAALPPRHEVEIPADHPFAGDLDLFGRASLACLLDTPSTPMGAAALASWLLSPAPAATVTARQGAVADLAPRLDLRQELEALGRAGEEARRPVEPFLAWAEGEPWLARRPWLRALAWAGPLALVGLGALQALGILAAPLWPLALVANLAIVGVLGGRAVAINDAVAVQSRALGGYASQIGLLAAEPFAAPLLRAFQDEMAETGEAAPDALARLAKLAALPLPFGSMAGVVVAAVACWDIHVLAGLERWQAQHGRSARRWLAILGEAEALAALSALRHDNPTWVFPSYDPAEPAYVAQALGHPLLAEGVRKANDVAVGPAGTFLLVTGSNMSGKSTLLRAIGVNAVLAGAGGPVCVATLAMPPVEIWTSVRVQDSLERGVSFFMAELQRLKLVVDAADHAAARGGPPVLYLLDEILQGTNTAERQIAARRIIRHLVERGALGVVSTHDLALGDAPELAEAARPVHFRDEVRRGPDGQGMEMTFDRVLRPGVATTTNALRLMELIGLDLDLDP